MRFDQLQPAPPDAILGLSEAFKTDDRPGKINLAVGVFKDEQGRTPILESVREAQRRIDEGETSKSYMPIDGSAGYAKLTLELLLGADHTAIRQGRARTAHCPGGTGALRVAGELIKQLTPGARVWLSDPTWANHAAIFQAAGLEVVTYPYFDSATNTLRGDAMCEAIEEGVAGGDVVVLHGCCHNPTGVDLGMEHWDKLADALARAEATPLVDFAYQGFAEGLDADAAGVRRLTQRCREALVCSSYSKNFGLYNERVGALTIVAANSEAVASAMSHAKTRIRSNYSNPPAHGGAIVETILGDEVLRGRWQAEVDAMRERINGVRRDFAAALDERGVSLSPNGNGFITRQRGMFSFTGLSGEAVKRLREQFAVYIVGSGRVNVAGITPESLAPLADAIAKVV